MERLSFVGDNPGYVLGTLLGLLGVAFFGLESGLLWAVVGYFLGKTIQSTLWTVTGQRIE